MIFLFRTACGSFDSHVNCYVIENCVAWQELFEEAEECIT